MLVTTAYSSFISPVIPRSLRLGGVFPVQARAVGSGKMGENPAVSISTGSQSGKAGAIETGEGKKMDAILSLRNDPGLENMSVQELKTTLRSVGASTKGRKHELITALRSLIDKSDGETSQAANGVPIASESEPSGVKWSKRKKTRDVDDHRTVEVNANILSARHKILKETTESSGKGISRRKVTAKAAVIESKGSQEVQPEYENEPWIQFAHKKPQKNWVAYNPRIMRQPPLTDTKFTKLMSWNVNGLRALLKLEGSPVLQLAKREDFDVLCLQETKIQEKDVKVFKDLLEGYENTSWYCSTSKLGYSGTAIISRIKPLSVRLGLGIPDHDSEGRLITAEFDSFYLLSAYVPNSGDGLKRLSYRVDQWDRSLSAYIKELEKTKPVILTGDLNCAHEEIDIYNPSGNRRSAGFTDEERQSFASNFLSNGFVDTFRKQHPGVVGYTYWGYRHGGRKTNRGWRLDYFLVSESIASDVHDSYICPDVTGSDHSPIGLVLKL